MKIRNHLVTATTLFILLSLPTGIGHAQCVSKSLQRPDGRVGIVYPPESGSPLVGGNEDIQIGLSVVKVGSENYIAAVVRFRHRATTLSGTLRLILDNGQALEMPIDSSELTTVGGSETGNGAYRATNSDIIKLQLSALKSVGIQQTTGVRHFLIVTQNRDLLQIQARCAAEEKPVARSSSSEKAVAQNALDSRYGFKSFRFGTSARLYEGCKFYGSPSEISGWCSIDKPGKIGEIQYESVYLTFAGDKLGKIGVKVSAGSSAALIAALESAFGRAKSHESASERRSRRKRARTAVGIISSPEDYKKVFADTTTWSWVGEKVRLHVKKISTTTAYRNSFEKTGCDHSPLDSIFRDPVWISDKCVYPSLWMSYSVVDWDSWRENALRSAYRYNADDF